MYIDDGLLIELDIGDRKEKSLTTLVAMAKSLLSNIAINEEKTELEGAWSCDRIIHCFDVNARDLPAILTEEKRAGATLLFDGLFSQFGCRNLLLSTLQCLWGGY